MTYGILLIRGCFGKSHIPTFRAEYRIVAETSAAGSSCHYFAMHLAFKKVCFTPLNKCDDCAEAGIAIVFVFQIFEQQCHVCGAVVSVTGSITSRTDSWFTAKSIHLKAGVIGKTIITITLIHPTRLLQRIALKSICRFGNIVIAAYVRQRKNFISFRNLPQLFELMGVIGSKN